MKKIYLISSYIASFSLIAALNAIELENTYPGSRFEEESEWVGNATQEVFEKRINLLEGFQANRPFDKTENELLETRMFSTGIYQSSHNGVFYNPVAIYGLGSSVAFHDGSLWEIAYGDEYKILNWLSTDKVVLSTNYDSTNYRFNMTNQNTNVTVRCNMTLGPIYKGMYTRWVVGINFFTQQVQLSDGSTWQICGFDLSAFSKWALEDTIMIGINNGYLSSTMPNLLIDVETLTAIRAVCIW